MKKKEPKYKKINADNDGAVESELEKFAGNPYTSLNGILFISFIVIISLVYLNKQSPKITSDNFLPILMISVFYFVFGSQLNYFLVSNKRLIVKNHFFFWENTTYFINSIAGTSFENVYKRSDALKITTSNNVSKMYSAGSLRTKHWALLRDKLQSLGI